MAEEAQGPEVITMSNGRCKKARNDPRNPFSDDSNTEGSPKWHSPPRGFGARHQTINHVKRPLYKGC
ncbi:hypothetical protein GUJ93_ZPchr0001g32506 [Zizania palustris]|uniref:Uncharacterized protein n=1 Tax=Zizania palustris TaxID=103762 RepID=A0A8J5S093_ZIZPA|nr:hypothetical protein GUJ93_ZPchr0001g32506 [Zizania palustris]